jgi:hypothetical protein
MELGVEFEFLKLNGSYVTNCKYKLTKLEKLELV